MPRPQLFTLKLARRTIALGARTLVMGVLNVTPDSFSDGGRYASIDAVLARAEEMLAEGADVLDVGGESTRPGAASVPADEEKRRVVPIIERLTKLGFPLPISLDTTKREVAAAGLAAGAEVINDVSALRFDLALADEVARARAGLILMHSRGTPDRMHGLEPVADILGEVENGLRAGIDAAAAAGVARDALVLDPGIGFGKSHEQNLILLAQFKNLSVRLPDFPWLVGTSRKSFIGKILGGAAPTDRLFGTMASVTAAVLGGAHIVRVHDVAATVETVRVADAIKAHASSE